MTAGPTTVRNMVVVLGDQLNRDSSAFDGFDPSRDVVVMAESAEEATCIPQHQQRLVLFFSAMRHFRDQLTRSGMVVHYRELDLTCCTPALAELMSMDAAALAPSRIVMTEPGDLVGVVSPTYAMYMVYSKLFQTRLENITYKTGKIK